MAATTRGHSWWNRFLSWCLSEGVTVVWRQAGLRNSSYIVYNLPGCDLYWSSCTQQYQNIVPCNIVWICYLGNPIIATFHKISPQINIGQHYRQHFSWKLLYVVRTESIRKSGIKNKQVEIQKCCLGIRCTQGLLKSRWRNIDSNQATLGAGYFCVKSVLDTGWKWGSFCLNIIAQW
jgi:hypothetical protein